MAKLYATLSSDKTGRTVSKGGDESLEILVHIGNKPHARITVLPSGTVVLDELAPECEFINMDN